ncbi:hypothetical protein ACDA63_04635 [Uliginosibacterium sp. sgz301328]|uniref:hypothetical protein n=1 Tax=Uliginosibacterium sp. sgz301328 TaxID=3243764 RepID=UPI00359E2F78
MTASVETKGRVSGPCHVRARTGHGSRAAVQQNQSRRRVIGLLQAAGLQLLTEQQLLQALTKKPSGIEPDGFFFG